MENIVKPTKKNIYFDITALIATLIAAFVINNPVGTTVCLIIAVLFIINFLKHFIYYISTTYVISSEYIEKKHALLGVRKTSIPTTDIRAIDVEQSLGGRILGVGEIKLATAATKGYEMVMPNVDNPYILAQDIEHVIKLSRQYSQKGEGE